MRKVKEGQIWNIRGDDYIVEEHDNYSGRMALQHLRSGRPRTIHEDELRDPSFRFVSDGIRNGDSFTDQRFGANIIFEKQCTRKGTVYYRSNNRNNGHLEEHRVRDRAFIEMIIANIFVPVGQIPGTMTREDATKYPMAKFTAETRYVIPNYYGMDFGREDHYSDRITAMPMSMTRNGIAPVFLNHKIRCERLIENLKDAEKPQKPRWAERYTAEDLEEIMLRQIDGVRRKVDLSDLGVFEQNELMRPSLKGSMAKTIRKKKNVVVVDDIQDDMNLRVEPQIQTQKIVGRFSTAKSKPKIQTNKIVGKETYVCSFLIPKL